MEREEAAEDAAEVGVKAEAVPASEDWLNDFFEAFGPDAVEPFGMYGDDLDTPQGVQAEGAENSQKRERETGGDVGAKSKKSRREKLRREALNDKFMELSALLDPEKPPKTDKATIVTEAAEVIRRLRRELEHISASLKSAQQVAERLETEKNGLQADKIALQQDKAALQQDKLKIEHQLHSYLNHLPFASPTPFPMPYAVGPQSGPMMVPKVPLAPNSGGVPVMFSMPPLIVHTTTAEEDAKLRAPAA